MTVKNEVEMEARKEFGKMLLGESFKAMVGLCGPTVATSLLVEFASMMEGTLPQDEVVQRTLNELKAEAREMGRRAAEKHPIWVRNDAEEVKP